MNITSEILEIIKLDLHHNQKAPLVLFLEGGHYNPREGVTDHTRNTLKLSIEITKSCIKMFKRNVRIVLGILVDDLGIECEDDICSVPEKNQDLAEINAKEIPTELENIMNESKFVKRNRVIISSERNAKNRGITALKKIINESSRANLKVDQKTVLFLDELMEIPISTVNGDFWSAKCPLIMGQHYFDVFTKNEKRFDKKYPQLLIDFSEIYDRNKVNNGSRVCLKLLQQENLPFSRKVVNVCFKDDECTKYTLDEYQN